MPSAFHQTAAKLAAAVYAPTHADIRNELHRLNLSASAAEIIDGPGPLYERAMVVPSKGAVYLVVRGTQSWPQWRSNFNARKRAFPGLLNGHCHRGFWHGAESLLQGVFEALEIFRNRPLIVVGHSRGAAIATLLAPLVSDAGYNVAEIHLFGAPRVLSALATVQYPSSFGDITFRWIANNDAVCRVPFRWMGYQHIGRELYFDSSDQLHSDPSRRIKLRGQWRGRLEGGPFDGLTDHDSVKEYCRLVAPLEFA